MTPAIESALPPMRAAGLPEHELREWCESYPIMIGDFESDTRDSSTFWRRSTSLLRRLPLKPRRSNAEQAAADALMSDARLSRESFLAAHVEPVYDRLTERGATFRRIDDLVYAAAALVPGLVPTQKEVRAEAAYPQRDKDGIEIDQGLFLAHVLSRPRIGQHLCHAMLLPRPEIAALSGEFAARGALDLAVDVATLDPMTEIGVIRGVAVENEKYRGKRIFGAGINLTHLYLGKIPYLWFMVRDLGYVHKLMRGVAAPESVPNDIDGRCAEKLWIAAVDAFAIGGHCQTLLCMDYVLAASDAFLTLPARKEGIIPGFSNLRLPRFVGDRIARQAILYERKLECDSVEGRLICDEIAHPDEMEAAIDRIVEGLTSAGAVSAIGNRRAFRVGQEPLDLFRRYASVYAREQAYCCFSPALIANLERNWDAKNRKI
jgi:thioesterase DpgC